MKVTRIGRPRCWQALVTFLLVLAVSFAGCSCNGTPNGNDTDNGDGGLTKIVLAQSPQPLATLSIIAYKKGFYKDEGLDVSVNEFTTGKLCFDAMLSGGAHFATVAETPIMYAGFSDQPIYVVASICSNPLSAKVIARTDKGVTAPADLKGKPVGTFKGGSAEYFFMQFLKKHGLTVDDVRVTYMQPPELVAAIIRGDLAAISMWEPHISTAQKAIGADKTVVFSGEDIYTETYHIATRTDYADTHEEAVRGLLQALIKAEEFVKSNPDQAKAIIVDHIQMDKDILERIWPHYRFEVFMEKKILDLVEQEAHFAVESGTVRPGSSIPDYDSVFQTKFLRAVSPGKVDMDK